MEASRVISCSGGSSSHGGEEVGGQKKHTQPLARRTPPMPVRHFEADSKEHRDLSIASQLGNMEAHHAALAACDRVAHLFGVDLVPIANDEGEQQNLLGEAACAVPQKAAAWYEGTVLGEAESGGVNVVFHDQQVFEFTARGVYKLSIARARTVSSAPARCGRGVEASGFSAVCE